MKKLILYLLLLSPVIASAQLVNITSMSAPGAPTPSITTSVSIISTAFSTNVGTASTSQTFTTSANALTGGGLVTAPTGYEVSIDGGSTYGSTKTISASAGQFTSQPVTVNVRLTAAAAIGTYNGNVSVSSSGATTRTVAVSGQVNSLSPSLSVSGSFSPFNTTAGIASTAQTVTVTGSNLTASATVTPPSPLLVSLNGTSYATSVTITQSGGSLVSQPVTVWTQVPSSATAGTITGNEAYTSTGATTINLATSGTVSSAGGTNDTVQVNIWDSVNNIGKVNLAAPNFWNEWNINELSVVISPAFKYKTGSQSPIQAQFDAINSYVDNGSGYNGSTTSGYPVGVFRVALFNTTTPNTLTLTGLPTATNGYRLEVLTSRSTATSRPNTFAVGATTQTVDAKNNDVTVVLDNLTPASGTITVNISSTNGFWFVNGFRLIKKN